MDPIAAKLILDELRKLRKRFEESDAWWESRDRRFAVTPAALEPRNSSLDLTISNPEQHPMAQIDAPVVADNWGGLFDGGYGFDKQLCEARSIVVDNWGGLFEQEEPAATGAAIGTDIFPEFDPTVSVFTGFTPAPPAVADNWGGLFDEVPVPVPDTTSNDSDAFPVDMVASDVESACLTLIASSGIEEVALEEFPLQIRESEDVEVDEQVLPSTGSAVFKVIVAQSNADQLLTVRVSALDRNSLIQGILSALSPPRRAPPGPPRLRQPRRAPPRPPWLRSDSPTRCSTPVRNHDANVVIITGGKPSIHNICFDVTDAVRAGASTHFTGLDRVELETEETRLSLLVLDPGFIHIQRCFSLTFGCSWDAVLYVQHRPWPPPSELQLVSYEARLRPLPWPSFDMVVRYSGKCLSGRIWKPPWYVSIRQQIMCVLYELVAPECSMMRPRRLVVFLAHLCISLLDPRVMNDSVLSQLKIYSHGRGGDRVVSGMHILVHTSLSSQPCQSDLVVTCWISRVAKISLELAELMVSVDISCDAVHLRPNPWSLFCQFAAPVHLTTSLSLIHMLVNSTQLYFGVCSSTCLGWHVVQYKPPWPPPGYSRPMHAERGHKAVISEWRFHVLTKEKQQQQCGGMFRRAFVAAGSIIEATEEFVAVHIFDYGSLNPAEAVASQCFLSEGTLVEISEHMDSVCTDCSPCYVVEEQTRQEAAAILQSCCRWRISLLTVWISLAMIKDELSEVTVPTSNQLLIQYLASLHWISHVNQHRQWPLLVQFDIHDTIIQYSFWSPFSYRWDTMAPTHILWTRLDWFLCCIELQPWPLPAILRINIAKLGYDELQSRQRKNYDVTDPKTWLDCKMTKMSFCASINPEDRKIQQRKSDASVWCHGILFFSIKDLQVPWDPGATEIFHRLGGKPKLKKGGMLGTTHGWACIWAMDLGLVKEQPASPTDIIYKRAQVEQGRHRTLSYQNTLLVTIHLPPNIFVLVLSYSPLI